MSATVPMEFNFGTSGNLKSARRLRNLDLKKQRPTVHPLFGNTGSVVGRAYAASGGVKPGLKTGPGIAKPASSLSPVGKLPTLIKGIASEQGTADQGGQVIPSVQAQNPVIPSAPNQVQGQAIAPTVQTNNGFFSSGKNIALAGGGLIALVIIVWMMFGKKSSRKKRRKANNGKKSRKR